MGATFGEVDPETRRRQTRGQFVAEATNEDGQAKFEVLVPRQTGVRMDVRFAWDTTELTKVVFGVPVSNAGSGDPPSGV